jgi:biotin carboxyl carrier protein
MDNTDLKKELLEQEAVITDCPETFQVLSVSEGGRKYKTTFTKKFENRKKWQQPNPEEIKSFIPGTVNKILVAKGDTVKAGDALMVYVAMKMSNIIRAPFDGIITDILVNPNDRLPKGVVMLVLKAQEPAPDKDKDKKEQEKERRERIKMAKEQREKEMKAKMRAKTAP